MRIRDYRDKPHVPSKIKSLSSLLKINKFFKNINGRKRSKCDKNKHKHIQIPVDIYQRTKRFFVRVQPKNACKF